MRTAVRDMRRPAPWHVVPNERFIAPGRPASTYEAVPMLPGMNTGCPAAAYSDGISGWSGGKARVAPLRCTQTIRPSWRSSLATLCATS